MMKKQELHSNLKESHERLQNLKQNIESSDKDDTKQFKNELNKEIEYCRKIIQQLNAILLESAKDYESSFDEGCSAFIDVYEDAELIDYAELELQFYHKSCIGIRSLYGILRDTGFKETLSENEWEKVWYSRKKKIAFIMKRPDLEVTKDTLVDEVMNDKSDLTPPQRVLLLHKAGIIDYLREKAPGNETNIAKLLSLVTGMSAENMRRQINDIKNKGNNDPTNPKNNKAIKAEFVKLEMGDIFYPKE